MTSSPQDSIASKADQRISPASLATLVFALIAISASMPFVFAVLPPIGRDLGLSELQFNLIVSQAALVFVPANGFWGNASERPGRKPVVLLAFGAATLATLAFGPLVGAGTYRFGQVLPYMVGFVLLLIAADLAILVTPTAMRMRRTQLQQELE